MSDRRQGDRRENSSLLNKRISISLKTFIFIIVLTIIVITSVFLCMVVYARGFDNGYSEGYSDALSDTGYVSEYNDEIYVENADEASNIIE